MTRKKLVKEYLGMCIQVPSTYSVVPRCTSTEFKTLLVENEEEIRQMGYDLEDSGTHSIHKGTTTYASFDTTASGGRSISMQGGWTMSK
eukprot:10326839-Ditylum_brightwellii.AAC.1